MSSRYVYVSEKLEMGSQVNEFLRNMLRKKNEIPTSISLQDLSLVYI
jgi:hypothetical protein